MLAGRPGSWEGATGTVCGVELGADPPEQEKLVAMNLPLGDFSSPIILTLSVLGPPPEKSIQPNRNTDVNIKRIIFFMKIGLLFSFLPNADVARREQGTHRKVSVQLTGNRLVLAILVFL